METAPDLKLSPSEKWTLQKIAQREYHHREFDWIALQRLKKEIQSNVPWIGFPVVLGKVTGERVPTMNQHEPPHFDGALMMRDHHRQ